MTLHVHFSEVSISNRSEENDFRMAGIDGSSLL